MELKSKVEEKVTTTTYTITLDDGRTVVYKEFIDDSGRVIDCELRDEEGRSLDGDDDAASILEAIEDFLDETEGA